MALYKNGQRLSQSNDQAFDTRHTPGTPAPHPGIYRCTSCGDEIAIAGGHVASMLNRLELFGIAELARGKTIFAWCGGAMAVDIRSNQAATASLGLTMAGGGGVPADVVSTS